MMNFPFHMEHPMNLGPYNKPLKCFPVIMMAGKERKDVDRGGKSKLFFLKIRKK